MGLNWIAAFKLIPWGEVAAAAPGIVKGAKNLWSRSAKNDGTDADRAALSDIEQLAVRMEHVEATQTSVSDLINALAKQNAQLVAAVAVLRSRMRVLSACCGLTLCALMVLWWH